MANTRRNVQCRHIVITNNSCNESTNVTQEITSVVDVNTIGPQGPVGPIGLTGPTGSISAHENLSITGSLFISGGGIIFNGDQAVSTVGATDDLEIRPDAKLKLGPQSTDAIEIGRQTVGTGNAGRTEIYANSSTVAAKFQNSTITFNHPITASSNISASGQFLGSNFGLDSTDKLEFSDATLQFRLNDGSRITHTPTIFRPTSDEGVSLGRSNEKWKELVVNHITASGNISASGGLTIGGDLNLDLGDHIRFGTQLAITKENIGELKLYGGTNSTDGGFELFTWNGSTYDSSFTLKNDRNATFAGTITSTNITASGNISGSGTGSFEYLKLDYDNMPDADPNIKGVVYRNGSNQLFISAG